MAMDPTGALDAANDTPMDLNPLYEWIARDGEWVLIDRNSEVDFTGKHAALDYDTEVARWVDNPALGPAPMPEEPPAGAGGDDEGLFDKIKDFFQGDADDPNFFMRPNPNWILGSAGPGPFAQMAPWAAWNALPNMIADLNKTMDYWLTRNQQASLHKSDMWAFLKAMGMATGNQIDLEGNVTPIDGGGGTGGGGTGGGGTGGGSQYYGGAGPSKLRNITAVGSDRDPVSVAYTPRGIDVETPLEGSPVTASANAISTLLSPGSGTGNPVLDDIVNQGLVSSGNQSFTGGLAPTIYRGGAQMGAERDRSVADQTMGLGQAAAGLGASADELGLAGYETEFMRKSPLAASLMNLHRQLVS